MPSAGFLGDIHRFTRHRRRGTARSPRPATARRSRTTTAASTAPGSASAGRGEMIPNEQSYCEIDPVGGRSLGHPGAALPLQVDATTRYNQVRHMQQTFRALIDQMGGTALSPMPSRERGYGIEPGGRIIHEVGVTRMGHSPTTSVLNAQCQAHDVQEPVRGRRRPVRHQRRQERDLDDPGAGDADQRVHRRRAKGRDGSDGRHRSSATCCSCWRPRRLAAGFAWTRREASAAHDAGPGGARRSRPGRRRARRSRRRSSPRTSGETVRLLADLIIPARRAIGQRHRRRRARVHGLPAGRGADAARGVAASDRDARRPGLARPRMPAPLRQDVRGLHATASARRCSTTSRSRRRCTRAGEPRRSARYQRCPPGSHGRAFFASFRDLTATGFWTQPDGHGRPAVPGQSRRGRLDRLSASGPGEARRQLPGA